ncbi:YlxR family protein, partial [Intestinimonas massiliensis]
MPKKIPMRQCVGCREMKSKRELIRVVRSPEGEVPLDFKGKKPGRGAYLCPAPDCLARAKKSRALERAFSAPLPRRCSVLSIRLSLLHLPLQGGIDLLGQ